MTVEILPLFAIFVGHFFADFIFHTKWMIRKKAHSWIALQYHGLVYTLVITVFIFYTLHSAVQILLFSAITFVTHTLTDLISSKLTALTWKNGRRDLFFLVLGFDQMVHYVTMLGTLILIKQTGY